MATQTQRPTMPQRPTGQQGPGMGQEWRPDASMRASGEETKLSFKTTEFWIYLASVAAILIASAAVGMTDEHSDYFRADRAWAYIVVVTAAYLVSRGLAKAGSMNRFRQEREGSPR